MVETMKSNGSTVLLDPADMFWGERFARVRDPFGHEWGITTKLREMAPDEIHAAATQLFAEMSSNR
jgi:PhnB protein